MAERRPMFKYDSVVRILDAMNRKPQSITPEILFYIVPDILASRGGMDWQPEDPYNSLLVGSSSHLYLSHSYYPLMRESSIDLLPMVDRHPRITLMTRKSLGRVELFLVDAENGEEQPATVDQAHLPFLTYELLVGYINTPVPPRLN